MNRKAKVYMHGKLAGQLEETETGYSYHYHKTYLENKTTTAISLTLPLSKESYTSNVLFPFFDGLIPEGWLLDIAQKNWKLNQKDRMGLLLTCCNDCIGAISVVQEK